MVYNNLHNKYLANYDKIINIHNTYLYINKNIYKKSSDNDTKIHNFATSRILIILWILQYYYLLQMFIHILIIWIFKMSNDKLHYGFCPFVFFFFFFLKYTFRQFSLVKTVWRGFLWFYILKSIPFL